MRRLAVVMTAVALGACTQSPGSIAALSPSPTSASASPERTAQASPEASPIATQLNCGIGFAAAADMVLNLFHAPAPVLEVLDATDPLKPRLLCTLIPADGGQFGRSPHEVVFWVGNAIGLADLAAGTIREIGKLPPGAIVGAYARTRGDVVYTVPGDGDGFTRHLVAFNGQDSTLYTQQPIGGHGGPPCGPYYQLQFSPDGAELLDYSTFRPTAGPANLMLFNTQGSLIFQQSGQSFGLWAPTGHVLYFGVSGQQGLTGEIDSIDGTGHRTMVATGLRNLCWPATAPDGGSILFDAYDTSAPGQATGGLPHLWRLDLGTQNATQLTTAITTEPVFVGREVVWVKEGKPCDCGPGGASAPDGVVLALDLLKGTDSAVDMSAVLPGIGGPPQPILYDVLDAWFS